ncbi:MAG: hypothetical protein COA43_14925 [Robiginitomaculum sp.]|nr:MAG: hypothetical protein COA43_14925 [Robiginitomaculum sp.]
MSRQHFDDYFLYQLAMASHNMSTEFYDELKTVGLKPIAWRILYCLWSSPNMRLTDLAHNVLLKQPRVTNQVVQLEADGLLKKTLTKNDRRNLSLVVTKKGRKLLEPLIEKSMQHEDQILSVLSDDDRKRFRETLTILIKSQQERLN